MIKPGACLLTIAVASTLAACQSTQAAKSAPRGPASHSVSPSPSARAVATSKPKAKLKVASKPTPSVTPSAVAASAVPVALPAAQGYQAPAPAYQAPAYQAPAATGYTPQLAPNRPAPVTTWTPPPQDNSSAGAQVIQNLPYTPPTPFNPGTTSP